MAHTKDERTQIDNSFAFGMTTPFTNPMLTIFADLSGTVLEGVATAQKDWADFFQRRIREDVAVSRQLMSCHSLADMHHIYSRYFQTALDQYREQSEKVVRRSEGVAQHLAEVSVKEGAGARH